MKMDRADDLGPLAHPLYVPGLAPPEHITRLWSHGVQTNSFFFPDQSMGM